jgi:SanA protein
VRRMLRIIFRLVMLVLMTGGLVLLLPSLIAMLYASGRTHPLAESPARPVAIVFGAGLLRDRVETAVELYFAGKVDKLLMSGDNQFDYHNEPGAMREYALILGVPDRDIVLDYAGRRTYDTCYRAGKIFGVQQAILVTQSFHLPRAIYTCNMLGVNAVGVPAAGRQYRPRSLAWWHGRELPATLVALWEVHISHPLPVLGNPEPIFSLEAQ